MPELKIAVHLPSLQQPFKKALHIAARLGARGVEIDGRSQLPPEELTQTAQRQIRKMLNDLNLQTAAVSFLTRRGYNVQQELDRRVAATKQAMRTAYALGSPVIVNHVGEIPEDAESPDFQLLVEVLSDIGRFGQHVGVMLAARTGSDDPSALLRLIAALPTGSLAIDLDPGSLAANGYAVETLLSATQADIFHVRATDAVRDRALGRGAQTPLGRGLIEFPSLLAALEERGYRGYFTVQRDQARDPETELAHDIQFLNRL